VISWSLKPLLSNATCARCIEGETPHELTDEDFASLGAHSEGFSGSDIDHVVRGDVHTCRIQLTHCFQP
jgi:hypothetical protein